MSLFAFNQDDAHRIGNAVRKVEGQGPPVDASESRSSPTPKFWVEITGESSGLYSWKLVYAKDGAFVDADPAQTGTSSAYEANGATGIASGTHVELTFAGYVSGAARYVFTLGGSSTSGIFPVVLVMDGGVAGGGGVACSWTYSLYPWGSLGVGTPLATGVGLLNPVRYISTAAHVQAGYGFAAYDGDTLQLLWCDETVNTRTCEDIE